MIAPPRPPAPEGTCAHCGLPAGRAATRAATAGTSRTFCCYGCYLAFRIRGDPGEEAQVTWWLVRLGTGAFLSMNVMLGSAFLYAHPFAPDEAWLARPIQVGMAALATAALAVLLPPIARAAAGAMRCGRLGSEVLVLLGAGAAWAVSALSVARGEGEVWLDTACAVPLLFTLGRWLEAVARAKAARRIEPLLTAGKGRVTVLEGEHEVMRDAAGLSPGTRVLVRPGESIPVDGVVEEGLGAVDEAVLTGESLPRRRGPGSPVMAGSRNGDAVLVLRVTAAGLDTRRAELGRSVCEALARRGPLLRATDRAAALFVPGVLLVAAAVPAAGGGTGALLAVLAVACPCAIGLAAPLALAIGIGEAARRGITIRDAETLEALAGLRAIAFDKTGTLAEASPRVVAVEASEDAAGHERSIDARGDGPRNEVLSRAAALGRVSRHPLARGIVAHARRQGLDPPRAREVWLRPGRGMSGLTRGESELRGGDPTALGDASLLEELGWRVSPRLFSRTRAAAAPARSIVLVGWSGEARGFIALEHRLRPEVPGLVARLLHQGLRVYLLSGDRPEAVARAAREAGIEAWQAELSPESKRRVLASMQRRDGPAGMVGDGINDGPVLASASVAIAVAGGSDFARAAADVVLAPSRPLEIDELLLWAKRVRATVRGNLTWALGYNTAAIAAAAMGALQPVLAAVLMAVSSLTVVLHTSARLQRM